jgi:DNA-binding CsgD family transcriptional regulator
MLVQRRERQALRISVVPFCSSYMLTEVSPCALIFISDPEARPASRATILSALYQLTPAECRLADFLLGGLDVAAAAERMRLTTETARFMLKSVFHKTGTHRQSELMRFLLGLPNVAVVR